MTISQLLRIFLARYKLGLIIFIAIVATGLVASLLWPGIFDECHRNDRYLKASYYFYNRF